MFRADNPILSCTQANPSSSNLTLSAILAMRRIMLPPNHDILRQKELPVPTFYIIRHAHKETGNFYNPRLRHQDEPISLQGQEHARTLWSYLCDKDISAIYISGYQRTRQTIEYVAQQSRIAPVVDERLNEIDNGCFDGVSTEEIQGKYPDVWKAFQDRSADFRFPEGETGEEARQRIAEFLEEKRHAHADENVAAVSHEGLIRLTACHILGLPVYHRWNFLFDFCGIMEITYQPDYECWKLIRFNQHIY